MSTTLFARSVHVFNIRGSTLSFSSIFPLYRTLSCDYQRDLRLSENIIHFHINIALEQSALRIFTMKEYDT